MKDIVKILEKSYSAKNVKQGFQRGDYDLEGCIYECLSILTNCGVEASQHIKTESIMIYLNDINID